MVELEIIEHYKLLGEHRWRVRVAGTKIVLNVSAETAEEALAKASRMLESTGLKGLLEQSKRRP